MSDVVRVSVIGRFQARLPDGRTAAFRTSRAAEIVARLAVEPARRMLRSRLAAELWPDADRATGLRNLRPSLNYARVALESSESIISNEDWLRLGDSVETDWLEVERLEVRIREASTSDERLVLLYSLNGLVQKPFLDDWDRDWVVERRLSHDQMRTDSLRRLCEELGNRGEWRAALDYARQIAEVDPVSEDGIRLQLRFLGELDRPQEAQRIFGVYRKNLKATLGLNVNPGLASFAEEVAGGRFRKTGSRPLTAIQQEMIADLISALGEEEPERLLPLLGSSKLNWALVLHGREMLSILERAMAATSGWSPERCGVAKRLLQVYAQEQRWQQLEELAQGLYASADPADRVASLNYQGFVARADLDYPGALKFFDQAVELAGSIGDAYLAAISTANRAILNITFELYRLGLDELDSAQVALDARKDHNARFGSSLVRSWAIAARLGMSDEGGAQLAAQNWRQFAETNGTLNFDWQGKLAYGATRARAGDRSAKEWMLGGIDAAFQTRSKTPMLEASFIVAHVFDALGLRETASQAARAITDVALHMGYRATPMQLRLLPSPADGEGWQSVTTAAEVLGFCRQRLIAAY